MSLAALEQGFGRTTFTEYELSETETLEDRLKQYFLGQEKKVVFLKADQDLPYGFVITVIDIAKRAGVEVVGLVTDPIDERERRQ